MDQAQEKPFYDIHIFCCVNQRAAGHPRGDCASRGAVDLHGYLKARLKMMPELGSLRVNQSGCLDRCELGPVLVIYPQGIWYHAKSTPDLDEIIDTHLIKGEIVQRLRLKNSDAVPPT